MEFLPKPLWQKFGISTIFKDILGLPEAQIAAVVSGCITSCTCVCISEGMFVLKKADFFSSLCCGTKEEALGVPAILEVIFHPWIVWYGWQWVPVHNCSLDKSQPSNFLTHKSRRRCVSVCAEAQYLQSQLLCVSIKEHWRPQILWSCFSITKAGILWVKLRLYLWVTPNTLACSPSSPFTAVPQVTCLEFIIQGKYMNTRFC